MHGMWGTLQLFIEKYHPGQIISNRVANLTNNNIMPHFQKFFIKERYKSLRIVFLHRKKQWENLQGPRREETWKRQEHKQQKREKTPKMNCPLFLCARTWHPIAFILLHSATTHLYQKLSPTYSKLKYICMCFFGWHYLGD